MKPNLLLILTLTSILMFGLTPSYLQSRPIPFISDIPEDLGSSFLSWPVMFMVSGGVAASHISTMDLRIQKDYGGKRYLGKGSDFFSAAGTAFILDPLALGFWGLGKLIKNDSMARTGEALVESVLLTEVSVLIFKDAFHRERPDGGQYSFPSGHTARAFTIASVMAVNHGPIAGIPAYAIASLIGFSRFDKDRHYMSDILFGAAIGTTIGVGTSLAHNKVGQKLGFVPLVDRYNKGAMLVYRF
jgi:membrane-associated phospholipid phosphatase